MEATYPRERRDTEQIAHKMARREELGVPGRSSEIMGDQESSWELVEGRGSSWEVAGARGI